MTKTQSYAVMAADAPFTPYTFERREPGPHDVQIEILFCGICHSDLHYARNEWGGTTYPAVPGHEIVGRVVGVGRHVKGFKAGDQVGVGCMVYSCQSCPSCEEGLEQYCEKGFLGGTYGGIEKETGQPTRGGYSAGIVVDENFVLRIPDGLDLAAAAPLLCAGITTYSPLRHWKAGKGKKVGVVGLGGLGHMAVKLAHAMGSEVVLFTTSPGKTKDAERLGAKDVVISKEPAQMKHYRNRLDLIIDTVAAPHDLDVLLSQLKRDGTLVLVGAPASPHPSPQVAQLMMKRRSIAGSAIGGIRETQEMLDFCGAHKLGADVEIIPIQDVDKAYERMLKSDVKYRFVIDLASLKNGAPA